MTDGKREDVARTVVFPAVTKVFTEVAEKYRRTAFHGEDLTQPRGMQTGTDLFKATFYNQRPANPEYCMKGVVSFPRTSSEITVTVECVAQINKKDSSHIETIPVGPASKSWPTDEARDGVESICQWVRGHLEDFAHQCEKSLSGQ